MSTVGGHLGCLQFGAVMTNSDKVFHTSLITDMVF